MNLLEPSNYYLLDTMLCESPLHLAPKAVLEGYYPGAVFVDNPYKPETAVVWLANHRGYLLGRPHRKTTQDFLALLFGYIFPLLPSSGEEKTSLELAAPGDYCWLAFLDHALARFTPGLRYEMIYRFDPAAWRKHRQSFPPVCSDLELVTGQRHIQPDALTNPQDNRWQASPLPKAILQKQDNHVTRCESSGILAGQNLMIQVETCDSGYLRRGCATQVADGLLELALSKGLTPWWVTREDNLPHQRLARKLGFTKVVSRYPVYTLLNK